MKRLISVLLIVMTLVSLSACSSSERVSVSSYSRDEKLSKLFNSTELGDIAEFFVYRSERYAKKLSKLYTAWMTRRQILSRASIWPTRFGLTDEKC